MRNIKQQILNFFGSIDEFDKRSYLRDCVDIMTFNRKELVQSYPYEVFLFLKLARISKLNLSREDFLDFVNKATEQEDREINYFIYQTMCNGIEQAHSYDKALQKLKNINEKIPENQYSYEHSL